MRVLRSVNTDVHLAALGLRARTRFLGPASVDKGGPAGSPPNKVVQELVAEVAALDARPARASGEVSEHVRAQRISYYLQSL